MGEGDGAEGPAVILATSAETQWIAIGSVATALLAVGTFWAVIQGRSERQQIVTDRELTWRPALSGTGYRWISTPDRPLPIGGGDRPLRKCILTNAGGGPALSAKVLWVDVRQQWTLTAPVDISAHGGESDAGVGGPVVGSGSAEILASIGLGELEGAIFCRDFLERRWCFPVRSEAYVLSPLTWRDSPPALWRKIFRNLSRRIGRPLTPLWASHPLIWG